MFLLIVVFYYFGLIFGAVGEPPYEDGASTCNRGVARKSIYGVSNFLECVEEREVLHNNGRKYIIYTIGKKRIEILQMKACTISLPHARMFNLSFFFSGVVFTFLFFWLMMIILIVLFVIGGPMYSEICRNLIHIEESPVLDVSTFN